MSGYEFVPLPDGVRRVPREAARHDRRLAGCLFGRIIIEYECEQPVHIGSGFKDIRGGDLVRLTATRAGTPIIPGSSFKGLLRARFEAITHSCLLFHPAKGVGRSVRSPSHSRPTVRFAKLGAKVEQLDALQHKCSPQAACPACALFGCQSGRAGLRSRVTITDLVPVAKAAPAVQRMPAQFGPRLHHVGDSDVVDTDDGQIFVVQSLYGRKFNVGAKPSPGAAAAPVETMAVGTRLRGELRLFNVEEPELGGLLAAAGMLPSSYLKVGSAKGHGFGRLRPVRLDLEHLLNYRGAAVDADAEAFRTAFKDSADRHPEGEQWLIDIHNASGL